MEIGVVSGSRVKAMERRGTPHLNGSEPRRAFLHPVSGRIMLCVKRCALEEMERGGEARSDSLG